VEGEPQASPDQEAQWWFDRLFRGIALDDDVRQQVRVIMARTVARQRAIHPPAPGVWDLWDEAMQLYADRDALLASLLTSPADKAAFEANAAEVRRELAELWARAR
jgi:hypothetical protein